MHYPCLLSACCMLGSSVLSAVMGTWERWAWVHRGRRGDAGQSASSLSWGRRVYRGVWARGLRQLLERRGLCLAASPDASGILSSGIPSRTPAPPQPAMQKGSRAPCLAPPAPKSSSQVRKLRPGEPREGLTSTRGIGGRAWRRAPGRAFQLGAGCRAAPSPGGAVGRRRGAPTGAERAPGGRGGGSWREGPGWAAISLPRCVAWSLGSAPRPPLMPAMVRKDGEKPPGAASPGRWRALPAPPASRRKCDPARAASGPGCSPAPAGLTAAGGPPVRPSEGLPGCAGLGGEGLQAARGRVCASPAGSPAGEQGAQGLIPWARRGEPGPDPRS